MKIFSHISTHLPKFAPYLNKKTADECLGKMIKENKGEVLVSFYKKAAPLRFDAKGPLKHDAKLKELLNRAVELQKKLPKKMKQKFEKVKDKWEKVKKANKAAEKLQKKEKAKAEKKAHAKPHVQKNTEGQNSNDPFHKLKLGAKNREVAFAMDWSKDDPVLFNMTYMQNLITQKELHPDMQNVYLSAENKSEFTHLLSEILLGNVEELSKENANRVRQMTLAILNTLNQKRTEPAFQETYATIVVSFLQAFTHCSNRINTEVEAIFNNLCYPKDGNLGRRIRLVLQRIRALIFHSAVHKQIAQNPYYLKHGASSFNYYNRKMAQSFGLAPSVAELDKHYADYAMKGREKDITELFDKEYTPVTIYNKLSEIMQNPEDNTIPCKLFTDWIEARYGKKEMYSLLDESGKYSPKCFIRLFKELEIFSQA